MDSQRKQDLLVGISVLLMFVGAFTLTTSSLGLLLMAGGSVVVLSLIVLGIRKR